MEKLISWHGRRWAALFLAGVLLGLLVESAHGANAAPPALVDLDATSLTSSPVKSWKNAGSLGGEFAANDAAPEVAEIAGRKAVRFDEEHYLASSFATPEALVGDEPFTLAVL